MLVELKAEYIGSWAGKETFWCPDCEDIFIVSQTRNGGQWNKIAKSQDQWWYNEREAQEWLDAQPDWFRISNRVFSVRMSLTNIKRTDTSCSPQESK